MIAVLRGRVVSSHFSEVVLDVSGVGYGISLPVSDVTLVHANDEMTIFIAEVIREQSYDLYGFLKEQDKALFLKITKVSGVGPKSALSMMGIGGGSSLAHAIQNSDISFITKAPGVGKKLAERLCVELKDSIASADTGDASVSRIEEIGNELEEALTSLGFKKDDVERMTRSIDSELPIEDQIRAALKEK